MMPYFSNLLPLVVAFSLSMLALPLQAKQALNEQQQGFLDAYQAIKKNDRQAIADYKHKLKDYELYPYIEFLDISMHLDRTPKAKIQSFLAAYPQYRISKRLTYKWLSYLGRQQDWKTFNQYYAADQYGRFQTLKCYHFQANPDHSQAGLKTLKTYWLAHKMTKACRPIESNLLKHKALSGSDIWQKIAFYMNKGHLKSAKRLEKHLSATEKKWLASWQTLYRHPNKVLQPLDKQIAPVIKKQMFTQGVQRLARKQPQQAEARLRSAGQQYGISQKEAEALYQEIAIRKLKKQQDKDPEQWLELSEEDPSLLEYALRQTIRNGNWQDFFKLYAGLEENDKKENQWRYWHAQATLNTKTMPEAIAKAKTDLAEIAQKRGYYSFLAADALALPYQFNPAPKQVPDKQALFKKYPTLKLIQELVAVDWLTSAQREWHHLLNQVDEEDFEAISYLASDWNQHHLAIQTLGQVKKWDLLDLRFPTPYQSPIMKAAEANQVDPTWVYGIIRRESAFSATASSHAGAIGLMQLMPQTARFIGRKAGISYRQTKDLQVANKNIQLGTAYLSYLLKEFNNNQILATAAYNAGPSRVKRWIPKDEIISAPRWVEGIPYKETRSYVKAVMEYMTIFQSIVGQDYQRLEKVMHPIGQLNQAQNK